MVINHPVVNLEIIKILLIQFVLMKTAKQPFLVETTATGVLIFLDIAIASLSLTELHFELHQGLITF